MSSPASYRETLRSSSTRRILDSFRPLASRRIVDIGAGEGSVLLGFEDASMRVALDIDTGRLARAATSRAPGGPLFVLVADAGAIPFAGGVFDVAIMYDVLEHVPEPTAAVREARRVLRDDGLILVTAANRWSPISLLDDPHAHVPLVVALPARLAEWIVHTLLRRPRDVMGIYPRAPSWRQLHAMFRAEGMQLELISNLRKLERPDEVLGRGPRVIASVLRDLGLGHVLRSCVGRPALALYDRHLARSWTFVARSSDPAGLRPIIGS